MMRRFMNNPWETIQDNTLLNAVSARRVLPDHPVDMFWAKDAAGALCFLVDNIQCDKSIRLPQLFGVELILAEGSPRSAVRLIMKLRNREWWQVFYVLCCDIVESTKDVLPRLFVNVLLKRLEKWQLMLRLLNEHRLTQQEVQGLWGELMFMYKHIAPKFGWLFALNAWKGPVGHPQDFSVKDVAIEVKTVQNTGRRKVLISSLDQLDPVGDTMYLHVSVVGLADDISKAAMSLNELVERVKVDMGDNVSNRDLLDSLLAKAGYVYNQAYDMDRFLLVSEYTYEVRDGFPRICKSKLPLGVESGEYSVFLGNSDRFLKKPNWMEG